MQKNKKPEINDEIINIVNIKVNRLIRSSSYRPDERDDIVQELLMHLHRRLPKFDPEKAGLSTYIDMVLSTKIILMVHERRERQHRRPSSISIEEFSFDDENEDLKSHVLDNEAEKIWDREKHRADLRHDLEETLSRLPANLREIARMLGESRKRKEIAEKMGIHRDTVLKMIYDLRSALKEAGIDEYL